MTPTPPIRPSLLADLYRRAQTWLTAQTLRSWESVSNNTRFNRLMNQYEDAIGITEIKATQSQVLNLESEFVAATSKRRTIQQNLLELQNHLKEVRQKLDGTHRGDEKYLDLVTREHQLIKSEIQCGNELRNTEEIERELFSRFSRKLRDAHEVERIRQEKTKYLSLIGSVTGAMLGIVASSVNHHLKMRDVNRLVGLIEAQHETITSHSDSQSTPNSDFKSGTESPTQQVVLLARGRESDSRAGVATSSMNSQLNKHANIPHSSALESKEVQTSAQDKSRTGSATGQMSNTRPEVVSVQNDIIIPITHSIALAESNLEQKIKLAAVGNVAATYALAAVLVPILIVLFSGERGGR